MTALSAKDAFDPSRPLPESTLETLAWLDSKDDEMVRLEQENERLKAENADLYRKAYFTIRLPKWMRRR